VDDNRKALGFSEYHPADNLGKDQYRSQANRRVEVLFFDEGEEPDTEVAEKNPEGSEIYLPGYYEREHLKPMKSAKPWRAYWENETVPAKMGEVRNMILEAPGLAAGEGVVFTVYQVIEGGAAQVTQTISVASVVDGATAPFRRWYNRELVKDSGTGPLPKIDFRFEAETAGRIESSKALPYRDLLEMRVLYGQSNDPPVQQDYRIHSPWGRKPRKSTR
jgi:hypothetical protein